MRVVYMNKRGVGLAAGGKTGEIIYNFIGSPYHEKTRIKINRVFQTGQAGRLESSVSNHRGERIHYFSNLGAIKDDQGGCSFSDHDHPGYYGVEESGK